MNRASKLFVVACCIAALAPVVWHVISSLKTPAELTLIPPTMFPHDPTTLNYRELFQRRPFLQYYLNSFTIAAMSRLVCVAAASLAAYMMARTRRRFRSVMRSGLLVIAFFPPIVFLFPLYELVRL